ncbi:energy transducer TonB [Mucilaginibacter gotjawali]|uniref:Gram-negative bacterial tonB protein n=2 Tax=Mucilaginibacter gotjawali TaxID=1550579 RepID=A0A0X8X2U3_9SPHI|nr:energy transducer TonB [Mucilaginibacter gotjawali]MBB3053873.1 TonB family protein [Mucilaginibacter gotjawali]BAU54137.1 Gram-negative bacterial tonB protein [Mucilaginibacter gotjawali]
MLKPAFAAFLFLFLFNTTFAQKRDTLMYALKYPNQLVSTKDSADFFRMLLPPDTTVDKNLYVVQEFYKNGKLKLIGGSYTNAMNMVYHRGIISYFQNGHKKMIENYEDGEKSGSEVAYYPNGKVYTIEIYTPGKAPILQQCNDSTGKVLTENGNGKWIDYFDDEFKKNYVEGMVKNGQKDGRWNGVVRDSVPFVFVYKFNNVISSTMPTKTGVTHVEVDGQFPGGPQSFHRFINHFKQYPEGAKEAGIKGAVKIGFIVEGDGSLSNFRVLESLGYGCDEEAIRVIKSSPKWRPYQYDGMFLRHNYVVSVDFGPEGN